MFFCIPIILLCLIYKFHTQYQDYFLAKSYITSHGYKIIQYTGRSRNFLLSPNNLSCDYIEDRGFNIYWDYKNKNGGKGRNYHIENFIVTNHQLDNFTFHGMKLTGGKTNVRLLMCDHKVVEGTSQPVLGRDLMGSFIFSFNGKYNIR